MKFKIYTLGCKVNSYESNYISKSLQDNGFFLCDENDISDIVIVNTCTVTDTSDKKSLKLVRRVKRENPNCILVICGCSVQYDNSLYNDIDADIVLGNVGKSSIVSFINEFINNHKKIKMITTNRNLPFENMSISSFEHIRAYIKIEDGCDNFCSYCIIPFVRGSVRSKDFDLVVKEATCLANNGYKEIVLTGIDTGSYKSNEKDLTDLINELSKIDSLERIRLSSVEITQLNDKFLNMLKTNKKFCHHLHIPLQSGSNEMLKIMNRKYDINFFEDRINKIREIIPDISITTDVIVGHNYETDDYFNECYEFCKKVKFAKIHAFPFSLRNGTKTSRMEGKIKENIKHDRCLKLIELSNILEKEYYDKFKGKYLDVLIEEVNNNKSVGHTGNYLKVEIDKKLSVGSIYKEEIK